MIINGGAINGGVYQDQFGFIANGLVLNLDAVSYSGTGTTWPAQVGSNATLSTPLPAYTASSPTYFNFDPATLVRIYNTALTAQQVAYNFNGTRSRFGL
jgi:hypothetical protein